MKSVNYKFYNNQITQVTHEIKKLDWIQTPQSSFQANLDKKQKNSVFKLIKELYSKEFKSKLTSYTQITKFIRDKIKKSKQC